MPLLLVLVLILILLRSEEHTSELQSRPHLVCRLLLEKKKKNILRIFFFIDFFILLYIFQIEKINKIFYFCFFFNDTATTEIYTLSLHDALPIRATVLIETILAVFEMDEILYELR